MPISAECATVFGVKMEPFYQEPSGTIYNGDALTILKTLPDESVQMCMCSPPYWGLRNYAGGSDLVWGGDNRCEHQWESNQVWLTNSSSGVGKQSTNKGTVGVLSSRYRKQEFCSLCGSWKGQLGLEPTPELYVEHLMMIVSEVKRVLKKSGSFYLNIGDTYASGKGTCFNPGGGENSLGKTRKEAGAYPLDRGNLSTLKESGLKPKCMTCIPERVMFAMLEAGWILRNKIIWHKPNAMPGSQKDRFSCSWEYLYFFTKARRYYFDLDAIRIPHTTKSLERYQRGVNLDRPAVGKSAEVGPMQQYKRAPGWFQEMFPPDQDYKGKFDDLFGHGPQPQSFNLRVRDVKRGKKGTSAQGGELTASEKEIEEYEYPEKHHGSSMSNKESLHRERQKHESADLGAQSPARKRHSGYFGEDGQPLVDFAKGKNPGDVIEIHRQKGDGRIPKDNFSRPPEPEVDPNRAFHAKGKNPGDVIERYDSKYLESDYGQPLQGFQRDQTIEKARAQSRKDAEELYPSDPKKQQEYINFIHDHQSHAKGKNPGDYWDITTQPSSICVCPKCEAVFPRYTKVCPTCRIEGVVGHFAPYPVALCEMPIKASTRVGDVVLDPLAGGGNTGVAAKKLGRKCILIDCVKEYCIMAQYKLSKIEYQPELEISC